MQHAFKITDARFLISFSRYCMLNGPNTANGKGEAAIPSQLFASMTIKDAATEFLARKRIAVTGVSRKPQAHAANAVYRRLRQLGYEVFAVNPNADQVEGDRCFRDLKSIPGSVEAVVIGEDEAVAAMIEACAEGPFAARVGEVAVSEAEDDGDTGFRPRATA